jgi:hypothetical protein
MASTRQHTPDTATPDHAVCRCPAGPLIVATFRHGDLADVQRRHWISKGCNLPAEAVDPKQYQGEVTVHG